MTAPAAGARAPEFQLPTTGGGTAALKDYAGRKLVLYFYPGDGGSTCTTEALDFTAALADFEAAGTAVLGVSPDSVASHEKFATKRGLGVTLAADEDTSVCQAYGVWQQKQMYGRTYMGVVRATFLIDAQGRIARAWTVSRVKGHVAEVLEAAKAL